MKTRKIPMRSCVVTREKYPKGELLRIVRTPEGEVKIDEIGKMNGKGAYIKKDIQVLEKAIKSKVLERALEVKIPNDIYEVIRCMIN
ncbi:MAG: YlxR family protein [Bacilli bacterium]|nr:YlxR family protein [Bacilli bacterium]